MEEMATKRIRCNFTDADTKFFAPKHAKVKSKPPVNITKRERDQIMRKGQRTLSLKVAIYLIIGAMLFATLGGILIGIDINKSQSLEMLQIRETEIRREAVAAYQAELEREEAEAAAAKMDQIKDEATRRNEEVLLFTKLFEGVRAWNFDMLDLVTYGVCVWNRTQNPSFADTVDEVIHQKDQWINFSDNNDVVADYKKIAEKLVDLLYNSDVQLCSTKYCWMEIRDGHLYLKDSFNAYPGMILWRYQGES